MADKQRCERFGKLMARKVFEKRGNHHEAHLTEEELGLLLDVEVRQGGKLIRKSWCATAPSWIIDGPQARALVIECAHYRAENDAEEGPEYEWCVLHADLLTETSYYRYGEI